MSQDVNGLGILFVVAHSHIGQSEGFLSTIAGDLMADTHQTSQLFRVDLGPCHPVDSTGMVVIDVSSFSYLRCLEVTHAAAPSLRHQPGAGAGGPGHLAIESEERQPLLELSPR